MSDPVNTMSLEEYRKQLAKESKRSKYGNKPVEIDGEHFASQAEAERWADLQFMQQHGLIRDLRRQVPFDLHVNGECIGKYVADATYIDVESGRLVVEDVKSPISRTPIYAWKKRHMLAEHGIEITEIDA